MRNLAGPDWVFDMDHWRKISCLGHIAKPEVPLVCTSNLSSDAGILLHGEGWEVCFMGNTLLILCLGKRKEELNLTSVCLLKRLV